MAKNEACDMGAFLRDEFNSICDDIEIDHSEMVPRRDEKFIQKFLKDSKGELVINEKVHDIMHQFRRKARRRGYKKYMYLGAFGHGKSLVSGTCVLMYDLAKKKVDDIKVGDLLMGPDGTPRKVLSLDRGKEQSYKIILKNKDTFSCNESHKIPFYISNRWNGYKKGDVIVMTIKEYLDQSEWVRRNVLKIQKTKLNFGFQPVPINPYVYGVWLGDGHCGKLAFTINDDDTEIIEYIYDWSEKHKLALRIDEQESNCTTYYFSKGSNNSDPYYELDFVRSSSINGKRIDERYLKNARFIRLQLLAGMIDTDGHLFDNCFEWSTKWIDLRDDFLFLCRSLGFRVSHRIKYVNDVPYYVVIVSGDTYKIPCKTRKKASKRKQIKNPLVYGFDIEDIGEQEYFGVVLDKDHLYLQDDFTIHHNTEQMCIGLALAEIARNPNILIKIVHISETEASNRVRAIKDYIEGDDDFKALCPHVQQTPIWGQQKFIVKRKGVSKDPTVQGYSVLSSSLGGRANLIIFDDISDLKSAVLEPTTRENVESMFKTTWNTRLIPDDSEAILLVNKWHEKDIANHVQNNPIWAWCSIAITEDKENILYEDSFGAKKILPLWSKYGQQALIDRHIEMGDRDYNRGFRLIPYTDNDISFPSFETCCRFGIKPEIVLGNVNDWIFGAGIDFSSMKRPGTIMFIGALNKYTGMKIPVDIQSFLKPSDLAVAIIESFQRWGIEFYMAENNAVQDVVIDLLQTALDSGKFKRYNINIDGFCTGKNKADPNQGIPSLQKEMEKATWLFPFPKQYTIHDNDDKDLWGRFYREMKFHPFYGTSDIVMSLWMFSNGAKKYQIKQDTQMIH